MEEGEKARDMLLSQATELDKANKTPLARTSYNYIELYNKLHKLGLAFLADGETRKEDFHIHIGSADTD